MTNLVLLKPQNKGENEERLTHVLERAIGRIPHEVISTADEFERADLKGKRLIFAVSLGASGINIEHYEILKKIRLDANCFDGSVGGAIVDGGSEFHTKGAARELVLSANMSGCTFVGKSLVEGTGTLKNFNTIAKNLSSDNLGAYAASAESLVKRVAEFEQTANSEQRILMIHAGKSESSNTIMLWDMVKKHLGNAKVSEVSLLEGEIKDCKGCPYTMCRHFGEQQSCFYGGVITERVYPEILACDALVVVSPNYNDAAPAYITAMINRLTSLSIVNQLEGKRLYAVVVSGYSGGDLVAMQLIGALNMNKPFILPPKFAFFETANDAGEIKKIPGIEKVAEGFARGFVCSN